MRISLARRFAKHTQALQLLPQIQIQQQHLQDQDMAQLVHKNYCLRDLTARATHLSSQLSSRQQPPTPQQLLFLIYTSNLYSFSSPLNFMQLAADYLSADPAQHLANPQHTQIMQQLLVSSQKDQQTELKVLLLKYYKERLQEGGSLEQLDKLTTLLPQDDEGTLLNLIDQRLLQNLRNLAEEQPIAQLPQRLALASQISYKISKLLDKPSTFLKAMPHSYTEQDRFIAFLKAMPYWLTPSLLRRLSFSQLDDYHSRVIASCQEATPKLRLALQDYIEGLIVLRAPTGPFLRTSLMLQNE